jgi:hypothetical protein
MVRINLASSFVGISFRGRVDSSRNEDQRFVSVSSSLNRISSQLITKPSRFLLSFLHCSPVLLLILYTHRPQVRGLFHGCFVARTLLSGCAILSALPLVLSTFPLHLDIEYEFLQSHFRKTPIPKKSLRMLPTRGLLHCWEIALHSD